MSHCPRSTPSLTTCPTCGAEPTEDCPLVGMTPGLVESAPITAGVAAACDPTDGVCEACQ